MATTNTTKSVKETKVTSTTLDADIKNAAKILGKQKTVKVTIPAYLQNRLGKVMAAGVNGATVQIPVDGKAHAVPESIAEVVNNALENLTI